MCSETRLWLRRPTSTARSSARSRRCGCPLSLVSALPPTPVRPARASLSSRLLTPCSLPRGRQGKLARGRPSRQPDRVASGPWCPVPSESLSPPLRKEQLIARLSLPPVRMRGPRNGCSGQCCAGRRLTSLASCVLFLRRYASIVFPKWNLKLMSLERTGLEDSLQSRDGVGERSVAR